MYENDVDADDSLEKPTALPISEQNGEDDEQSSGEEEGGLDWTKLPTVARPVIPKRGEKDFEPRAGGGSGLQTHILDTARAAMFDTLRATRAISSKAISYAIWYPDIARAHVTVAKGIHFSAMGHSAPRSVINEAGVEKVQKRLELLPEEAIYLVERGSLFCFKATDLDLSRDPDLEDIPGAPMSVQQVYSEMIGLEDLTLERFQVFAYLKRLGYAVTRTNPPNSYYPLPPPHTLTRTNQTPSVLQRISSLFSCWMSGILRLFRGTSNWWRPVHFSRWLSYDKNYGSLYRSLRFIPAGHGVPLHHPDPVRRAEKKKASPYQIFFNLYKPSTPFKRSAPPEPDFQIVVINARTTPMPTLQELTDLFDLAPELPPPLPRQRRPILLQAQPNGAGTTNNQPSSLSTTNQPPMAQAVPANTSTPSPAAPSTVIRTSPQANPSQSILRRLFPWAFPSEPPVPPRKPHPFMALKSGKKMVVIAVVDAGNIGFFRFGQGDFTEWPMNVT